MEVLRKLPTIHAIKYPQESIEKYVEVYHFDKFYNKCFYYVVQLKVVILFQRNSRLNTTTIIICSIFLNKHLLVNKMYSPIQIKCNEIKYWIIK